MNQISFGAKIPAATCQVKNIKTQNFEEATIYKYTCDCDEDLEAIKNTIDEGFQYSYCVLSYAQEAMANIKRAKHEGIEDYVDKYSVYLMENNQGQDIAMCLTEEDKDKIAVKYLESKDYDSAQDDTAEILNNYKYSGSTMLAALAKTAIRRPLGHQALRIINALPHVEDFYTKACLFSPDEKTRSDFGTDMDLKRETMPSFIRRTEEKTQRAINIFI